MEEEREEEGENWAESKIENKVELHKGKLMHYEMSDKWCEESEKKRRREEENFAKCLI